MGSEQELARIELRTASDAPSDDMHVELVDARQSHSSNGRHTYSDPPSVLRDALVSRCGWASLRFREPSQCISCGMLVDGCVICAGRN